MTDFLHHRLGRRERQIMDALFRLEEGTVAEVVDELGDESIHDSVRVTLRNLEKKGLVRHREADQRYVYRPAVRRDRARQSAMDYLMRTFFEDSPSSAILAFLDMNAGTLSDEELEEIQARIDDAAAGSDGDDHPAEGDRRRTAGDEDRDGPTGAGET